VTVAAAVIAEADADAPLREALEANERLARLADELRAENARLQEELARRDARIEQLSAELAVLQRLVFGRSSERARPEAAGRDGDGGGNGTGTARAAGRAAGRAGRGRGLGGGITRICPGSR
jgi:transposase